MSPRPAGFGSGAVRLVRSADGNPHQSLSAPSAPFRPLPHQRVMRMDPASRSCRTVAQAMTALGPELAERFRLTGLLFKNTGEPLPQELLATLWQARRARRAVSCRICSVLCFTRR